MPFSSFSQAEIILTERARLDRPLMLTVWVAAATFSIAGGQWFYLLATTFAVAVNMLAVHQAKEVYVHKILVNLAVLASTVILGIEIFSAKLPLIQALGHYLILLQLCKLFQHKGNRDYTQILALSALLMIAGTMVTNDLWFGLSLLIYIALLCHTAMVFTLKRGLDSAARTKLPTDPAQANVDELSRTEVSRVAWNVGRTWPARALRRRGALILVAVLACGVTAFLAAPRTTPVDPGDLPSPGAAGQLLGGLQTGGVSGFSNKVILGDVAGPIYQSMARVMMVRVRIPPGQRISATANYIRGRTFDAYGNSEWSVAERKPPADHLMSAPETEPTVQMLKGTMEQEISMDAELLPVYFASYPAVKVTDANGRASVRSDLSWRGPRRSPAGLVRYTGHCLTCPLSEQSKQYLAEWRTYHAAEPSDDPGQGVLVPNKVTELARRWCNDLLAERDRQPDKKDQIDLQIASRISERLRRDYSYTLDLSGANPQTDGVEDFLFEMKQGHCEYFASALAVMCRKLEVTARLATGFVLSEYDADEGEYIVRGRDAHAWVEVFTPSGGWVLFDPTPPGGRQVHGKAWGAGMAKLWNDLQFLWYENVVGYDDSTRRQAWEALLSYLDRTWTSFRNLMLRGEVDRGLVHFMLVIGAVGLFIEGVLIRRWVLGAVHRRAAACGLLPVAPKEVAFVGDLLKALSERGLNRGPDQTLAEFAAAAVGAGIPAEPVEYVVRLYYRIRWGRQVPTGEQLEAARRRVDEVRRLGRQGS